MMMCFNALFKALFWGTEGGFAFRAPKILQSHEKHKYGQIWGLLHLLRGSWITPADYTN